MTWRIFTPVLPSVRMSTLRDSWHAYADRLEVYERVGCFGIGAINPWDSVYSPEGRRWRQ